MSNIDLETLSDIVPHEALASLGGPRMSRPKPDISHLPDAIVGGIPQFEAGDQIVVERYAGFLTGKPYLDTRTYRVLSLDSFGGKMKLLDESTDQNAMMNWKEGILHGNIFKLHSGRLPVASKGKRGRPRKNPLPPPPVDGTPLPKKKGRGRPKGVKNRPAEVIRAEKAAMRAKRAGKKAARRTR